MNWYLIAFGIGWAVCIPAFVYFVKHIMKSKIVKISKIEHWKSLEEEAGLE